VQPVDPKQLKDKIRAAAGDEDKPPTVGTSADVAISNDARLEDLTTRLEALELRAGDTDAFRRLKNENQEIENKNLKFLGYMRIALVGIGIVSSVAILVFLYCFFIRVHPIEYLIKVPPSVTVAIIVASFSSSVILLISMIRGVFSATKSESELAPEQLKVLSELAKVFLQGK
jgi:hypothetical protein